MEDLAIYVFVRFGKNNQLKQKLAGKKQQNGQFWASVIDSALSKINSMLDFNSVWFVLPSLTEFVLVKS